MKCSKKLDLTELPSARIVGRSRTFSWGKTPQSEFQLSEPNLAKLEPSPKVLDTPKDRPAAISGAHSPTVPKLSQKRFHPSTAYNHPLRCLSISRLTLFILFVICVESEVGRIFKPSGSSLCRSQHQNQGIFFLRFQVFKISDLQKKE